MPSKKITAMPNWGGNQVPTDLVTGVDLSASLANQNVKSTLNDLFATITKNITDGAVRWAGFAAPTVSAAGAGSIYFSSADNIYYASENGGAYVPLITKPAGSNKQIQFNNSAVFGGAAGFEYQAGASPNVQITAQDAAYTALQIDSAATPSAPIVKIRNNTVDLYDFGVSDLTITKTTAFSIWLKTNAGAASSFRVGANSGVHPGSAYGLLFPYVGGSNSDGPGIYWTDGTYGSTVRLNLNLGLNFQGSGGVNAFRIRKATDSSSDGDVIFDFRPNDANFSLHPWGTNAGETTPIIFRELVANGTNYVGVKAPDSIANDCVWTLPAADGSSGQALTTNGSKVLSWTTISGGSVAGSNKQIQFNNSSAFGGAAGFEYQAGASPNVSITAQNAAYVPFYVNGASAQSASLQQWAINNTVAVELDASGFLYLGRGIAAASPQTGKIFATGGSGSNVAGGSLILYGGAGTGSGRGGSIGFYASPAGSSGSSPNAPVAYGELDDLGNWFLGDTNSLLGTSATDGFLYARGTNGVPAGTPSALWTGILPVTIDAVNYRLYSYIGGAWRNLSGSGNNPGGSGTEIQYRGGASTFSAVTNSSVSGGQVTLADKLTTTLDNATTNASDVLLDIQHSSSGTPAANFGSEIRFGLESTTSTNQDAGAFGVSWQTATHASRKSQVYLKIYGGASLGYQTAGYFRGIDAYAGGLSIDGNGTGGTGSLWLTSGGNAQIRISTNYLQMGSANSFAFYQSNALSGSPIFQINNSKVGIGIGAIDTAPATMLQVTSSSASLVGLRVDSAANSTVALAQYYLNADDTSTPALHSVFAVNSNGTAAAGFGGQLLFQAESSTTNNQDAAAMNWVWTDATHASRTAKLQFQLVGNAAALATVAEFDMDTTAGNTRLLIYDVDNATLERVSVGASDSGGTGFKVLRIPN